MIARIRPLDRRPDVAAIGAMAVLLIALAASRREFLGDGVRHLEGLFAPAPAAGAPRWLLFPPLLYALVHPLIAAGWITTMEQAIQPFLWLDVASGIVILWSLNVWLRADGCDRATRAVAIVCAGACGSFLTLFTDTAEPQLAAAVAIASLAFVRTRADDPARADRALIIGVASIAAATLIYQGVAVALTFLPLVVPGGMLRRRRALLASAAIVALVPVAMILARMAAGDSFGTAIVATTVQETNPLIRRFWTVVSLPKYVVAVAAGPPQGFVSLRAFSGLPAMVKQILDPATRMGGVANAARLALGLCVYAAIAADVMRRRDWRFAGAFAGLVALPLVRNQEYGYVKFYVLLPALAALAATHVRRSAAIAAAVLVLAVNFSLVVGDIARGRRMREAAADAYRRATPRTCWLTAAYTPPLPYLWPGTVVAVFGTLAAGDDPARNAERLTAAVQRCFCQSDAVWTDTTAAEAAAGEPETHSLGYRDLDLARIFFAPEDGDALALDAQRVYAYSRAATERICGIAKRTLITIP